MEKQEHEENNSINLEKWQKLTMHPRLGEILLQRKKIKIEQLVSSLEYQEKKNKPLGEILIELNFITKNDLIEVLVLQENIDKVVADSFNELKNLKGE